VVSNYRSVYGLRKILLYKEILILSGKNLTILYHQKKTFLISGIRFTYKCIIPDTKTKQDNFLEFLKYWPNSCDFNKLVIKIKIHAKTYFFEVFFIVWKYMIWFFLWETWLYAWEQKTFFLIFQCFDENRVF
jgi:hypothetical protein